MKRHIGLDILRIISMLMIVTLHFINKGMLNDYFDINSINFWFVKLIYNMSLVAVNCYVLISGFFLAKSKFKLKNIVLLWGKTLFWSVSILIIFILSGYEVGGLTALNCILSISMEEYWFITSYLILYAMFPVFNIIINNLNKRQYTLFLGFLIIVFSLWKTLLPISDALKVNGYTIVWLTALYFIGAYIRVFDINFKKTYCLLLYFVSVILTMLVKVFFSIVPIGLISEQSLTYGPYGQYNTFTILLGSVFLFLFFKNYDIKNKSFTTAIIKIAPLTLDVYLIHEQLVLRKVLWTDIINCISFAESKLFVLYSVLSVVGVFAICIIMGGIRQIITKKLKIASFIESKCYMIENRIRTYIAEDTE